MQSRIVGTTLPVLEFIAGAERDCDLRSWRAFLDEQHHPDADTHPVWRRRGIPGRLKRVAGGGSLFMTEYRAMGGRGEIAFATRVPGHIQPVQVGPGLEYMIHRHGFLCATAQVQLGVGFQQSLGAGVFGGDGFLLQKVTGQGACGSNCREN